MRSVVACCFAIVAVAVGRAEDKVIDNPAFPCWAKQKVGTTVSMKNVTEASGQKTESLMTYKVLEVGTDKVVVEIASKTIINGMEFAGPPTKMDIDKSTKVTIDPKVQEAQEKAKKDYTTTSGEETLKVSGKEYKCKWTKVKGKTDDVEYESTTWTSDDVPGMTVKMISKNTSKDVNATTTIEVTEIKVP